MLWTNVAVLVVAVAFSAAARDVPAEMLPSRPGVVDIDSDNIAAAVVVAAAKPKSAEIAVALAIEAVPAGVGTAEPEGGGSFGLAVVVAAPRLAFAE